MTRGRRRCTRRGDDRAARRRARLARAARSTSGAARGAARLRLIASRDASARMILDEILADEAARARARATPVALDELRRARARCRRRGRSRGAARAPGAAARDRRGQARARRRRARSARAPTRPTIARALRARGRGGALGAHRRASSSTARSATCARRARAVRAAGAAQGLPARRATSRRGAPAGRRRGAADRRALLDDGAARARCSRAAPRSAWTRWSRCTTTPRSSVALAAGARIIGVNHRDLDTLDDRSVALRARAPRAAARRDAGRRERHPDAAPTCARHARRRRRRGPGRRGADARARSRARRCAELLVVKLFVKICGVTHARGRARVRRGGRRRDRLQLLAAARSATSTVDERAPRSPSAAAGRAQRVGVFVERRRPTRSSARSRAGALDVVQLHGDETPELLPPLRRPLRARRCALARRARRSSRIDALRLRRCCSSTPTRAGYGGIGPARRLDAGRERAARAARASCSPAGSRPTTSPRRSPRCARAASTWPAASSARPGVKDRDKVAAFVARAPRRRATMSDATIAPSDQRHGSARSAAGTSPRR